MALVVLRRYAMLSEAHAAAAALRASGISAVLLDDAVTPPYSGLVSMGGYRLAVSDEDARLAAEALQTAMASPARWSETGPIDPWWEEEAERNPPVMPAVQKVGRTLLRLWALVSLVAMAAGVLGARLFHG